MPVYRKSRLVHIHIPKTAGTAVARLFHKHGDLVWGADSWIGQKYIDQRWFEYQHLSLAEFIRFTGDEFSGFQTFAVLRNPYSRLVSEYHWRKHLSVVRPDADMLYFDDFDQFLSAIPDDLDTNWDFHMAFSERRYANFLIHVRPQHHYIYARDGSPGLSQLFLYERLRSDLGEFLRDRGLDSDTIRQPKERRYNDYFDRRKLDRVNELYRKDFELGFYKIM